MSLRLAITPNRSGVRQLAVVLLAALVCFPSASPASEPDGESLADSDTRHVPPVAVEEIEAGIDQGIAFLLADQNKNGSWGSPTQTKGLNIYAPIPGAHHAFRCAVTALGISAIIESGRADSDPEIAAALKRAEDFLLVELPDVRRAAADALYNVWTHAYGIRCLIDMRQRALKAGDKKRAPVNAFAS